MRGRRVDEGGIRKGRSLTGGILRELAMDLGAGSIAERSENS
jgi:hypothetical protein